MLDINPFVYIIVFVGGLAFAESIFLFVTAGDGRTKQQRIANERLKRQASRLQMKTEAEVKTIFLDARTTGPILRLLTKLIPNRRPIDLLLYRAGVRMQFETFIGICFLCSLMGWVIGFAILRMPMVGLALLSAGTLPFAYVIRLKNQRMNLFMEQLPEAIELLCRSLKAGHPFKVGMSFAAEEMEDPVSAEFGQAVEEMSLGLDPRAALQNLGMRMNTADMPFLITAILIQRETGGDLPRVLGNLAKTMRERFQFQSKVKALVAQTSLSANLLATFPFFFILFLTLFSPGYLDPLLKPGFGRNVLYGAVFMTILGWVLCRRMTVVKV